jgi:hypothetical protein
MEEVSFHGPHKKSPEIVNVTFIKKFDF